MTPIHDGSRTPGWEGSVANTPARQSEMEEENWDSCFNTGNDYAPQTPGSNYASDSFSPYHTTSPSGYNSAYWSTR